jgi:hypothetical protein
MSSEVAEACDMNLGPRQRARRGKMGVVGGVLAAAVAGYLFATDAPALHRALIPTPLVLLGFVGFFQWRAKTCVRLAAAGVRNLDAGNEQLGEVAKRALRMRALGIFAQTFVASAVVCALLYVA